MSPKNCPLCGGDVLIVHTSRKKRFKGKEKLVKSTVKCKQCGCCLTEYNYADKTESELDNFLIRKWNTRI